MKQKIIIMIEILIAIFLLFTIYKMNFTKEKDAKEIAASSYDSNKELENNTNYIDIGNGQSLAITETNKDNTAKGYDLNTVDVNKVIVDDDIRKNVKINVIEDSITRDSAKVLITYPNDNKYNWDNSYRVEKKVGDSWEELVRKHSVAAPLSNVTMEDEINQLERTINYADVYDSLEDGTYRIALRVFVNYNKEVWIYSNEFEIK